jgi:streptomycin 6-kinase
MHEPLHVPEVVGLKARHLGPAGEAWLIELPRLVAEIEDAWRIQLGAPMAGGTAALVLPALGDAPSVVKIVPPDGSYPLQARTLHLADGCGYVRLFREDETRRALLMEALGPSLAKADAPVEERLEILSQMLGDAWRVPLPPRTAPAAWPDKAGDLRRYIEAAYDRLGRPLAERAVVQAVGFAERRRAAAHPEAMVVVHGDPDPANALLVRTPRTGAAAGYVFIDPDGFVGDPAYDLGVVLRGWCDRLLAGDALKLAQQYCDRLSRASGVSHTAIWEWGYVERVSTGLFALDVGAVEMAAPYLRSAEALAAG